MDDVLDIRFPLLVHTGVVVLIGLVIDRFVRRWIVSVPLALLLAIVGDTFWFIPAVYWVIRSPVTWEAGTEGSIVSFALFWVLPAGITCGFLWLVPRLRLWLRPPRIPQYSLRTLLLVVTGFAVLCSAVATILAPLRREYAAAWSIERSGGGVYWSSDGHVTEVYLNDTAPQASAFEAIHEFRQLRRLLLAGSTVTDNDLVLIGRPPVLRYLQLDGTQVSDESIDNLSQMQSLTWLDLRNTRISDNAVRRLQQSLPRTRIEH